MPELESFSLDPASPSDWSAVRAQGHRMLDDLFDHLAQIRERPVWQPIPAEVRAAFDAPLPAAPVALPGFLMHQECESPATSDFRCTR